jgi:hypothetical protein
MVKKILNLEGDYIQNKQEGVANVTIGIKLARGGSS